MNELGNQLVLTSLTPEILQQMIRDAVADVLKEKEEQEANKEDDILLTRQEVADIYKTSFVTLRQWVKNGIIPKPIYKGTRVYFRKSDIYNDINSQNNN